MLLLLVCLTLMPFLVVYIYLFSVCLFLILPWSLVAAMSMRYVVLSIIVMSGLVAAVVILYVNIKLFQYILWDVLYNTITASSV